MTDKYFSQLLTSINSVPVLMTLSLFVVGATAYKYNKSEILEKDYKKD